MSFRIPDNVKRARFSAITPQDARNALQNLTSLHYPTVSMVSTRQEIDLRAGAAFTRFLTKFIQNEFRVPLKGDKKAILSYGPCQFPTLGLVVDRLLTIRAFQPRLFYYLELTISCESSDGDKLVLIWERKHLFDRYCCALLYELCYSSLLRSNFQIAIADIKKDIFLTLEPRPIFFHPL
ncbi:DNA topoisomerase 3-alpha [Galdieria sulphuraria]|nr:DNA topoisomerase 3-alpha [Galdieria sulphuraria]